MRSISNKTAIRGFSLIEAIAVLLLMGIISAVVISRYSSADLYQLVSEEGILKGHLRYAQFRAMSDQAAWGISLSGNSYTLKKGGGIAPFALPGEDSQVHALPSGVSVSVGSGTTILFDQWGSPGAVSQSITLSAGSDSRTITITKNTGFIP
jgi:prepilin-type N-terminal cleavage/methylation domain-containing protein